MSTRPFAKKGDVLERMLAICDRLRGEGGCAWDREQSLTTLTPYLLEETHEVVEAVATGDRSAIREELGDLLYVVVFALHAAEVEGIGALEDVVDATRSKLIRRHPHVFGDAPSDDPDHARLQWQRAKRDEKNGGGSALGRPPSNAPSLLAAFRLQEKAAAVGFDWPDVTGPIEKVREELGELEAALDDDQARAREMGDLLFAAANVGRKLRLDPEAVLRAANRRFYDRFRHIERRLAETGRSPEEATLEEMESLWQEAKLNPPTSDE